MEAIRATGEGSRRVSQLLMWLLVPALAVLGVVTARLASASPCTGGGGDVCKCVSGSGKITLYYAGYVMNGTVTVTMKCAHSGGSSHVSQSATGSGNSNNTCVASGHATRDSDGTAYTTTDSITLSITGTNPACGPTTTMSSTTIANLPVCDPCDWN